jgi:hypothetical protein
MARAQRGPYKDGSMDVRVQGRYARLLYDDDHPDKLRIEDLDLDELAKGQLKDKNGRFTGRPPKFLPRQIIDAMRNEHYKRVNALLEESLSDMVKVMRDIAKSKNEDGGTRLKAAIYVYERFMGKTPERINITNEAKVNDIVEDILFDVDEQQKSLVEQELEAAQEELQDTKARRTPRQRMEQRRRGR